MKNYGFRLKVKMGRKWHHGLVVYKTEAEATARMNELILLGHKANAIKIQNETEIFC